MKRLKLGGEVRRWKGVPGRRLSATVTVSFLLGRQKASIHCSLQDSKQEGWKWVPGPWELLGVWMFSRHIYWALTGHSTVKMQWGAPEIRVLCSREMYSLVGDNEANEISTNISRSQGQAMLQPFRHHGFIPSAKWFALLVFIHLFNPLPAIWQVCLLSFYSGNPRRWMKWNPHL